MTTEPKLFEGIDGDTMIGFDGLNMLVEDKDLGVCEVVFDRALGKEILKPSAAPPD